MAHGYIVLDEVRKTTGLHADVLDRGVEIFTHRTKHGKKQYGDGTNVITIHTVLLKQMW